MPLGKVRYPHRIVLQNMHTLYSFIIFENMTLQTKMIQTGRFDTKVVDRRVLHVQRRIDLETAPYQPVPARHARGARSKTRLQLQVRRPSGTAQEEEPHQPVSEIELCTGQRTREPVARNFLSASSLLQA